MTSRKSCRVVLLMMTSSIIAYLLLHDAVTIISLSTDLALIENKERYYGKISPVVLYMENGNFEMKKGRVVESLSLSLDDTNGDSRHTSSGRQRNGMCSKYPWEHENLQTCNILHEINLQSRSLYYINRGGVRDVFIYRNDLRVDERVALKTLRLIKDFNFEKLEKHRIDALVSAKLDKRFIVDIFGYCAQSVINEEIRGTMRSLDVHKLSGNEKLQLAYDAASALNHTHYGLSRIGKGSIVHRDITPKNFAIVQNTVKINDFNAARVLDKCDFVKKECNLYRSPEECGGEHLSEKLDVYSLGHIFYFLLSGKVPYYQVSSKRKIEKMILENETPELNEVRIYRGATHKVLEDTMHMCYEFSVDERPNSHDIVQKLKDALHLMPIE